MIVSMRKLLSMYNCALSQIDQEIRTGRIERVGNRFRIVKHTAYTYIPERVEKVYTNQARKSA